MTPTRLLEITYVRSSIGRTPRQRRTIVALGLHRLHETIRKNDTPDNRAMIKSVEHLLSWREVPEGEV